MFKFLLKLTNGISKSYHQAQIEQLQRQLKNEYEEKLKHRDNELSDIQRQYKQIEARKHQLDFELEKERNNNQLNLKKHAQLEDDLNSLKKQYQTQCEEESKNYLDAMMPKPYCISEEGFIEVDIDKVKSEMKQILLSNDANLWTSAQEKMIFSKSRFVNVIAGAGSGKTTTMILRVIYMIKYLNIDIDHITIITFTRASRYDFIHKLEKMMQIFNLNYNAKYLTQHVVKTFHSKLFQMVKHCHLGIENIKRQTFELLDSYYHEPKNMSYFYMMHIKVA